MKIAQKLNDNGVQLILLNPVSISVTGACCPIEDQDLIDYFVVNINVLSILWASVYYDKEELQVTSNKFFLPLVQVNKKLLSKGERIVFPSSSIEMVPHTYASVEEMSSDSCPFDTFAGW